jgi:hypothetical protein
MTSDLGYWASILLWPAGVALLVLAVEVTGRLAEAKVRSAKGSRSEPHAGTPAE